jgi:transcriptional regulator with XRE-family HTH domain
LPVVTLKNLMRTIRFRTGLKQVKFGEAIGLSGDNIQTTVAHYEAGTSTPSIEVLQRALKLIGLSLEQCIYLPDDYRRNTELHQLLDRLLATERRDEIGRFLIFQHNGLAHPPPKDKPAS